MSLVLFWSICSDPRRFTLFQVVGQVSLGLGLARVCSRTCMQRDEMGSVFPTEATGEFRRTAILLKKPLVYSYNCFKEGMSNEFHFGLFWSIPPKMSLYFGLTFKVVRERTTCPEMTHTHTHCHTYAHTHSLLCAAKPYFKQIVCLA